MPNTSLSEAIKEAYASCPSETLYLETIEISHSESSTHFYLVRDRADWSLTLENAVQITFEKCPFRFSLPASGENGVQELNLAIDNVDRRISDFLESVENSLEPVRVIYRVYLASDTSAPQNNPPMTLTLRDVVVTTVEITGKATFLDLLNRKFPTEYYTRDRFPSLGN
jgi:hypothetical protein